MRTTSAVCTDPRFVCFVLLLLVATILLLLQVLPRTISGSGPAVNEDYICPTLPPSEVSEEWDGDPSSEEKGVW